MRRGTDWITGKRRNEAHPQQQRGWGKEGKRETGNGGGKTTQKGKGKEVEKKINSILRK